MKEYQDLLQKILDEGIEKESGRENIPNTFGIEYGVIEMDLQKGFPLLTTKKMPFKMIVHELLWFLRGETNIKYLVDNGVNIWNGDGYRWYQKFAEDNGGIEMNDILRDNGDQTLSMFQHDEFVEMVKITPKEDLPVYKFTEEYVEKHGGITEYRLGDLGKVYGHQWRNQNGVDQIKDVVEGLKKNPYSRYHIIDGWNKAEFSEMALPPCHLLYQFIVKPISVEDRWDMFRNMEWDKPINQTSIEDSELHRICDEYHVPRFYLNLNMYQRSCDTFLGVPFNIASMSLLLGIIAKSANMIPCMSRWIGGDVHLYMDHIDVVKEQIGRDPKPLSCVIIEKEINTLEDILLLTSKDFTLIAYESHDRLKGELFTGYKK